MISPAHLILTLLVLSATPINSFSLSFLRREIRNWMYIINTNVAGPDLVRRTQVLNFKPYEGLARRQRFQDKYGFHGQNLIDTLSQGEENVDKLIGYTPEKNRVNYLVGNVMHMKVRSPYLKAWSNHIR